MITKSITVPSPSEKNVLEQYKKASFLSTVINFDQEEYLEKNKLKYTEGIGLYHGIALRVPFITPEIISFGQHQINRATIVKRTLKNILYSFLPKALVDRSKSGFALPTKVFNKVVLEWRAALLNNWLKARKQSF